MRKRRCWTCASDEVLTYSSDGQVTVIALNTALVEERSLDALAPVPAAHVAWAPPSSRQLVQVWVKKGGAA